MFLVRVSQSSGRPRAVVAGAVEAAAAAVAVVAAEGIGLEREQIEEELPRLGLRSVSRTAMVTSSSARRSEERARQQR